MAKKKATNTGSDEPKDSNPSKGKSKAKRNKSSGTSSEKSVPNQFMIDGVPSDAIFLVTKAIRGDATRLGTEDNIMLGLIALAILLQISMSSDLPSNTVDALPSYKWYKKRILSEVPGRALVLGTALFTCKALIPGLDIDNLFISYTNVPLPFSKKFPKKVAPSESNFYDWLNGRMSQLRGLLNSCPATSYKFFNVTKSQFAEMGLKDFLTLILPKDFELDDSRAAEIANLFRTLVLMNSGGIEMQSVIFAEPVTIKSKIESEIFRDSISRSESSFAPGSEPKAKQTLSIEEARKYLDLNSNVALDCALRVKDVKLMEALLKEAFKLKKQQDASAAAAKESMPDLKDPPGDAPQHIANDDPLDGGKDPTA